MLLGILDISSVVESVQIRVFELLWAEQRSVEEVCAELAMKRDAVYAWRSRIRKLARALAEESAAEGAS